MTNKIWLNYLGMAFVGVLLFAGGFYFGFKTSQVQASSIVSVSSQTNSSEAGSVKVTAKEVEGIYWIKPGMPPNCPAEYLVKGRFDTTANAYYTPESKTYGRIKPDICFATEEIARDQAGFVKRY